MVTNAPVPVGSGAHGSQAIATPVTCARMASRAVLSNAYF
jgi:hypothetical protein